ncbi:glycosyltransferase family 4 protein [Neobacillus sp. WH10]|uniref:glycosyltransferase family 4 protein n=1 Tax=Neobacillus sp. WH10 TaxID=3047873 RepID=UPI0024C10F76|nr:glycosyltransferase family 4 protein [Neobacillus sp. WH10]WHY76641.1 glycosyltransferase family 4 protein [Neobacillus sp. WH10]
MEKEEKCIVTIMNTISETSMPFNEFVLYRNKKYPDVKQAVIVCSRTKPVTIQHLPDNIEFFFTGFNLRKIRRIITKVCKQNKTDGIQVAIHVHQPKSGLVFHMASIFSGFNKLVLFTVHSTFQLRDIKWKVMSVINSILANKVTIVSHTAYDSYPKWMKKIKGKRIVPLPNGVDLERIDSVIQDMKCEKKEEDVKTLIYVSRMAPFKNHLFLLKVLAKLQNYKLVLIGQEDKEGRIRDFINNNQMSSRVEMTGLISRNEVFARLKKADIYLSPSLAEGLPVSVLEAMYIGLPIIISDIGPHKEIGKYSHFIPTVPPEEQEWIQVLQQYLEMDRASLEAIGQECRWTAQKYYSLTAMHQQYDRIYNSLINES